jgi:xylulokinase
MGVDVDTIYATGGAAANVQILQVMADVFDAEVYQMEIGNSAALGAALRAHHADAAASGRPVSWERVIEGLVEPVAASRLTPQSGAAAVYRELMTAHAACEAHALGSGPDPGALLARIAGTLADAT